MNRIIKPRFLSIRYQIAAPLLAIQTAVALMMAISGAWIASERVEVEILNRLEGISNVLSNPQFPLTASILQRLRQLTGAHFISTDENDRPIETSFPHFPETVSLRSQKPRSLNHAPRASVQGVDYFSLDIPLTGQNRRLIALYPVELWRSARREALAIPLLQGLGGFLAMTAVTTFVSRRISSRLAMVEQGVERVANGQFEELALNSNQTDEIDQLANSINQMSRKIQEMQKTIETTEQMRVLAQVASGLAHQLRNSIAGARMAIQLHLKRCPLSATDESAAMALRQLQLTEEQIRGLTSQNQSELRKIEPVDLNDLVREVLSLLEPNAKHARVPLHFESDHDILRVKGNISELRTTIFNLVNNAIDAARPGGSVDLKTFRTDHGDLRLVIIDNGPGFPPDMIASIGRPFVTTKPEGLGLGLYLACQVAERHNCKLAWRREAELTIFEWTWPADSISSHPN